MSILRKIKNLPTKKEIWNLDHLKIIDEVQQAYSVDTHIDRSFAQFSCLKKSYKHKTSAILADLIVVFPLIITILFFLLVVLFNTLLRKKPLKLKATIAVLPSIDVLPSRVTVDKNFYFVTKKGLSSFLDLEDLFFIKKHLFKKITHPYFFLKCIYKLYKYSGLTKSECDNIYISNEYCFTSSILTKYLNENGIKVTNCMHGEKLLNCRDAFCTYDHFIIWDNHYQILFDKMGCKANFSIDTCEAIDLILTPDYSEDTSVIYYLQGNESSRDLANIKRNLEQLKNQYDTDLILVKEHPRFKSPYLGKYFSEENVFHGPLIESLKKSIVVSGSYTTILFQVYKSRDTLGFPKIHIKKTDSLEKLEYIMLDKADGFFNEML